MIKKITQTAFLVSLLALAACGQKGPLFIPDYDTMMNPDRAESTETAPKETLPVEP